ncbi:MAG: MATE family efflux transporter [Desulfovibrionaceae bacterium]
MQIRGHDTASAGSNGEEKLSAWKGPGSYGQVLSVGWPLVFSMISNTVMQFTDRIFLGNYSLEALAAVLPAGIASFLFMSFFMGVGEYVSVFVAQYTGAGRHERVGAALWQGIWFAIPSGLVLALLAFAGPMIFNVSGHPSEIRALEIVYFQILSCGAGLGVLGACLSSFYSGRGMTKAVMVVNMTGAALNIPLDYALINGWGPFPEMGIAGAGLATVTGSGVIVLLLSLLIFRRENEESFKVRSAWHFDFKLFRSLMRFGLPGGFQFFIDMFAVTFFVFMAGRLGTTELAATNIVISLDLVAFLPCVGFSIAASVLVGQSIGAGKPELGVLVTRRALHLAQIYMGTMCALFLLFPVPLLELFRTQGMSDADFAPILEMGRIMLRFVAAYSLLDAGMLVYSGALKGAGDSRYVMWTLAFSSVSFMVLPLWVLVNWLDASYVHLWMMLTLYACILCFVFRRRFQGGKWRSMSVIEKTP